jgi:hypothetical protein
LKTGLFGAYIDDFGAKKAIIENSGDTILEMGDKQRKHIRTNVPIFIELSLLKKGSRPAVMGWLP